MSDDDLNAALAWIQARLDRDLTIDTGTVILEGLVRGHEPGFRFSDEGDSYSIGIHTAITSVSLDAEKMSVTKVSDNELVIDTPAGRITLLDDQAPFSEAE